MCLEGSGAEALDGGEDVVGGLGPAEGLRVCIAGIDIGGDCRLQLLDGLVSAALDLLAEAPGLERLGDNLYRASNNSGPAVNGAPGGAAGHGTLVPGALEMSNVDLALEFTNMIIAQRGFQANSRAITTSDDMLQELVNLKR